MNRWFFSFCLLLLLAAPSLAEAQEGGSAAEVAATPPGATDGQDEDAAPLSEERVRVYLDCMRCDMSFIRTEVAFVDYVRDRQGADVHLLVTTQPTGAGGTEYAMQFNGIGRFDGLIDELRYTSTVTDSQDEVRRGMARIMSAGLVRYAARTTMAERLQLTIAAAPRTGVRPAAAAAARDPWNNWVFRTSVGGSGNLEASYHSLNINASASASRVTEGWKTTLSLSSRVNNSETKVRDAWVKNEQRDYSANALIVRSISDHWSIGGRSNANHSTFQNRDLALRLAPAIEFNFFPYSESTRRQLTLQYSAGVNRLNYLQETIFDKMEESLLDEALNLSFNTRQTWGSGDFSLEGSHYFHDMHKYRLQADGSVDFRIYGGLSLNLSGSAQKIHDQLHLVKGTLTPEQILLRQSQVATNYRYTYSVGIGYSFGSIFSGAVNPRLGPTGTTGGGAGGTGGGFTGGGGGGGGGGGRN